VSPVDGTWFVDENFRWRQSKFWQDIGYLFFFWGEFVFFTRSCQLYLWTVCCSSRKTRFLYAWSWWFPGRNNNSLNLVVRLFIFWLLVLLSPAYYGSHCQYFICKSTDHEISDKHVLSLDMGIWGERSSPTRQICLCIFCLCLKLYSSSAMDYRLNCFRWISLDCMSATSQPPVAGTSKSSLSFHISKEFSVAIHTALGTSMGTDVLPYYLYYEIFRKS
jgi:hypothetical protein